ncbi:MFS transporter [Protofrankia symbiont of Coriaria ruscifolia]|uniref:MFS transporter n=1 Tax=Protofrankia symbiont of Coriaria ruscifolia TaxID=1306542 RepID=UPI001F5F66FA|nr:MFS transporter [Protofrankia symbiont of Coriaria ruscifolia]
MASTQDDLLDPALLRLIGVLLLGGLMGLLDGTIVNVGVDTLGEHFNTSLSTIGWVATGYLLAVTVAIPLSAWATDRFGSRRIWLTGLSVFLVGSLARERAGPLDREPDRLPGDPGLRGRHAGSDHAHTAGARGGPGPGGAGDGASRLDVVGVALLCPAFAILIYALSQAGEDAGFGATRVLVTLLIGGGLLVGYIVYGLRARGAALIDLRLFTSRAFSASVTVMAVTGVMLFSMLFLVPLYYQQVREHGVLAAGLLLSPLGVGSFIAMPIAGRLSDRVGTRALVPAGAFVIALSALVFMQAGLHTSEAGLAVSVFGTGLGLGFVGAPTMGALYRTLPAESVPQGTSALYVLNQLGASLGIAVVALILQSRVSNGASPEAAFQSAFWWVFAGSLAVLVAGWFLPGRPAPLPAAGLGQEVAGSGVRDPGVSHT